MRGSATLAFSGQIFCDFAGYSTTAIGAAMCLGFAMPDNFRFPYAAVGFSDFWRRWHISLSSWLRDYLYIPLGGNRHGAARTYVSLMTTMLLGGLWHGASWTFVAWGGLHGALSRRPSAVLRGALRELPARDRWRFVALGLLTYTLVQRDLGVLPRQDLRARPGCRAARHVRVQRGADGRSCPTVHHRHRRRRSSALVVRALADARTHARDA